MGLVLVHVSLFHPLWVFAEERFRCPLGPELLATLVFGLGLCSAGIGGVRLILCKIIIIMIIIIIIIIISISIFSLVIIINVGLCIDVGA